MQHLVEVDGEVVLFLNDEFKVVFNVQILLELGIKVAMQVFDPLDDLDISLWPRLTEYCLPCPREDR